MLANLFADAMEPAQFDIITGNFWLNEIFLLFYYLTFGFIAFYAFIKLLAANKNLSYYIVPSILLAVPFGLYLASVFELLVVYRDVMKSPNIIIVLIYVISFSFVGSPWLVYSGFKNNKRSKAIPGLFWLLITVFPFFTILINSISYLFIS